MSWEEKTAFAKPGNVEGQGHVGATRGSTK